MVSFMWFWNLIGMFVISRLFCRTALSSSRNCAYLFQQNCRNICKNYAYIAYSSVFIEDRCILSIVFCNIRCEKSKTNLIQPFTNIFMYPFYSKLEFILWFTLLIYHFMRFQLFYFRIYVDVSYLQKLLIPFQQMAVLAIFYGACLRQAAHWSGRRNMSLVLGEKAA